MSIKITGAEWNRFYADASIWPDGVWHDDTQLAVDGVELDESADFDSFAEDAQITLMAGIVFMSERDLEGKSLESYFRAWRKKQRTVFFTCSGPKDKGEAIKAAIVAAGGKVHGL